MLSESGARTAVACAFTHALCCGAFPRYEDLIHVFKNVSPDRRYTIKYKALHGNEMHESGFLAVGPYEFEFRWRRYVNGLNSNNVNEYRKSVFAIRSGRLSLLFNDDNEWYEYEAVE